MSHDNSMGRSHTRRRPRRRSPQQRYDSARPSYTKVNEKRFADLEAGTTVLIPSPQDIEPDSPVARDSSLAGSRPDKAPSSVESRAVSGRVEQRQGSCCSAGWDERIIDRPGAGDRVDRSMVERFAAPVAG